MLLSYRSQGIPWSRESSWVRTWIPGAIFPYEWVGNYLLAPKSWFLSLLLEFMIDFLNALKVKQWSNQEIKKKNRICFWGKTCITFPKIETLKYSFGPIKLARLSRISSESCRWSRHNSDHEILYKVACFLNWTKIRPLLHLINWQILLRFISVVLLTTGNHRDNQSHHCFDIKTEYYWTWFLIIYFSLFVLVEMPLKICLRRLKLCHFQSIWIFASFASFLAQGCTRTNSIENYKLLGHTITSQVEKDIWSCFQLCKSNVKCQSINYNAEKSICELNNRTKNGNEVRFVPSDGNVYVDNPFRSKSKNIIS